MLRVIEADEDGVEVLLVVAEIRFGLFGNGFTVMRIALGESGNAHHLRGNGAFRLHGKEIVEARSVRQARDGDGRRGDLRPKRGLDLGIFDRRFRDLRRGRRILGRRSNLIVLLCRDRLLGSGRFLRLESERRERGHGQKEYPEDQGRGL